MATSSNNKNEKHLQCLIIGSGPAGLTAAVYAARANLNPLLLEGGQPGGQLTTTSDVENFPGFAQAIGGYDLIENMKQQAQGFGTQYSSEIATHTDFSKKPLIVETNKTKYTADTVIIATGASARYLGLPNELALIGHGVSACATCDGFFYKGKEVCVIGGGDSAMEEANFLTKFATKVTVIHRRDSLRASKIMQQRAFDNPKINFLWHSVVTDVIGDKKKGVNALKIKNVQTNEESEYPTQGLFLAIGHIPNTDAFKGQIEMNEEGYIIVKPGTVDTSVAGVYACGDCQDLRYKQAITAAGTGCMAAMDAEKYIETLHDGKHNN